LPSPSWIVHVPSSSPASQRSHTSSQATLQHTPSVQWLLSHSLSLRQASPSGLVSFVPPVPELPPVDVPPVSAFPPVDVPPEPESVPPVATVPPVSSVEPLEPPESSPELPPVASPSSGFSLTPRPHAAPKHATAAIENEAIDRTKSQPTVDAISGQSTGEPELNFARSARFRSHLFRFMPLASFHSWFRFLTS
jgi:hypothetical protein